MPSRRRGLAIRSCALSDARSCTRSRAPTSRLDTPWRASEERRLETKGASALLANVTKSSSSRPTAVRRPDRPSTWIARESVDVAARRGPHVSAAHGGSVHFSGASRACKGAAATAGNVCAGDACAGGAAAIGALNGCALGGTLLATRSPALLLAGCSFRSSKWLSRRLAATKSVRASATGRTASAHARLHRCRPRWLGGVFTRFASTAQLS